MRPGRARSKGGGSAPEAVLGDEGYDADPLAEAIETSGAEVVVPPKRNRRTPRAYDRDLHEERDTIERFFNTPKQFRRVATRCGTRLANFTGFVKLSAIAIRLRC